MGTSARGARSIKSPRPERSPNPPAGENKASAQLGGRAKLGEGDEPRSCCWRRWDPPSPVPLPASPEAAFASVSRAWREGESGWVRTTGREQVHLIGPGSSSGGCKKAKRMGSAPSSTLSPRLLCGVHSSIRKALRSIFFPFCVHATKRRQWERSRTAGAAGIRRTLGGMLGR